MVVEDIEEITNYVFSFFQDLFTSIMDNRIPELIDKVSPHITTTTDAILDMEFTQEEVKAILDHIGDLKALG